MARYYIIGGLKFHRRRLIKLGRDERAKLDAAGRVTVSRAVEWPLPGRTPNFEKAYVDAGGTGIWGSGPYLKVPNRNGGEELINRIFCPWGYPPERLRLARSAKCVELVNVNLIRANGDSWNWLLEFEPWQRGKRMPTLIADFGNGRARRRRAAQRP